MAAALAVGAQLLTQLAWCCCLVVADPYLNVDAGTMSPFEHGEVFVLDDGGEVCWQQRAVAHLTQLCAVTSVNASSTSIL